MTNDDQDLNSELNSLFSRVEGDQSIALTTLKLLFNPNWSEITSKKNAIDMAIILASSMVVHDINCHEPTCPLNHGSFVTLCTPRRFKSALTISYEGNKKSVTDPSDLTELQACYHSFITTPDEDILKDHRYLAFCCQYNLAVIKMVAYRDSLSQIRI